MSGTTIHDAAGLDAIIRGLADAVAAEHDPAQPLALVGIRTRGVPIAERLAARLRERHGIEAPVGAVDTTLYRDDLDRATRFPVLRGTDVPFEVDGAAIVLVDDVLFTGRSARAALDAVCALGRPGRVRLAVAVDRGGRELPIQADHVGARIADVPPGDRVLVRIRPIDDTDAIVRLPADR
jgi:pyrimidine operon attenuation protein/uracil phosphoribosyltransferase